MAKLRKMLDEAVISGYRGVVDYYYYKGVPCARAWPQRPRVPRSLAVQLSQKPFIEGVRLASQLSPEMVEFYKSNAASTTLTWRDLFMRSYLSGLPTEFYTGKC